MISEKAVATLYKCFNIPDLIYVESMIYDYSPLTGWHKLCGEPFNIIQENIEYRLKGMRL